jgi:hypothetical protein
MPVLRLTELHERELDASSDALFQRILDAGVVDVDAPWDDSLRILHIICMGNNRYVPELIRLSRDVNTPDASALRLTPLRTAVTSGSDLAVGARLRTIHGCVDRQNTAGSGAPYEEVQKGKEPERSGGSHRDHAGDRACPAGVHITRLSKNDGECQGAQPLRNSPHRLWNKRL